MFQYIVFKKKGAVEILNVEDGIGQIHDKESNTFQILNEKNVSILLRPPDCSPHTRLVLLVSSGHDNSEARSGWRRRLSEVTGLSAPSSLRLVFLVSSCARGARCELTWPGNMASMETSSTPH